MMHVLVRSFLSSRDCSRLLRKYFRPLGNTPPLLMKCTVLTVLTCENSLIDVWLLGTLVSTIY